MLGTEMVPSYVCKPTNDIKLRITEKFHIMTRMWYVMNVNHITFLMSLLSIIVWKIENCLFQILKMILTNTHFHSSTFDNSNNGPSMDFTSVT